VLTTQGNLTEALKNYQVSLAIRDRLAKADFNNANRHRIAVVLAKQGDLPRAIDELRQGRAIISRLARQSSDNGGELAAFHQSITTLETSSVSKIGAAKSVEPTLPDKNHC